MKRKLITALALLLAFLMMGSALATIIPLAISAEDKTFNTTDPVFIYDFSNDSLLSTFANTANMNVETRDGYTTFTATANDPYTWLWCPPAKPSQMKYVKILYRTTGNYKGEFFCTRSDNGTMGSAGTNQQWKWDPTGEWETIIVDLTAWKDAKDSVTFSIFRIDPLEGGVKAGSSIDIKYYAFFTTEADANGFDFDEYKAKIAYEEEQKKAEEEAANADPEIDALVAERTAAKKAKNFAEADRIRDLLKERGIEIIDTPQGAKWRKV